MVIRVFELFSGIGGMSYALQESGVQYEIVKAIDINTTANSVYKHNHPETELLERNIQCLVKEDFDNVDMIMMSPPCQPFTRMGLQKDITDVRTDSLLHIIKLLQFLKIKYLLLENVKGFEESKARELLIASLKTSHFKYQEFLLSPIQFDVPNSRLRYYLLAKQEDFCFDTSESLSFQLPLNLDNLKHLSHNKKCHIRDYVVDNVSKEFLLSDKILSKYLSVIDIVTRNSKKSCCFTKGYSHFIEGTGSVFCPLDETEKKQICDKLLLCEKSGGEYLDLARSLNLRYFIPDEISKLMCFPNNFTFPNNISNKQKYRLLGNSLNVYVVTYLTICLLKSK